MILTSFLKYYGEDIVNLLVSTIRSTNIYLCYPHQDFQRFINLKLNISMDNYYNKYLNSDIINQSNGLSYTETSYVIYDEDTKEFINKGADRKIIFIKMPNQRNGLDDRNSYDEIIRILIHEFIIRMKSCKNASIIRNSKKINRCGVMQSFYKLQKTDEGLVDVSYISESGRGFTMATSEIETEQIFEMVCGHELSNISYPLEVYLMKKILVDEELEKQINKAELYGNIPDLRAYFDDKYYDGSFDNLIKLLDEVITSGYRQNEDVYTKYKNDIANYLDSLKGVTKKYEG